MAPGPIDCVTHCLLVDTDRHGLQETAIARIQALGRDPRDVRHIVFTHLDLGHASGLSDFPWATAHAIADERRHASRHARRPSACATHANP